MSRVIILVLYSLLTCSLLGATALRGDASTDFQAIHCLKLHVSTSTGLLASWKIDDPLQQFCTWSGVTCSKRHTSRVVALDLESLHLDGQIPPCIAKLTLLKRIHLPYNQLRGPIPAELGQLNRLRYLNLTSNNLSGTIPSNLSSCSELRVIDLGSNFINGEIPPNLSHCSNMQQLNLDHNKLTGGIPEGLEYGFGSKISTEGDVYSYGVIILEMLTGKRPTDEMFKDGLSLYKFVEDSFPEKICEILDPRIIIPYYGNGDEEEEGSSFDQENNQMAAGIVSCITALTKLGLQCASETPKDRPAMQDVYSDATAIKEAFATLHG